MEKKEVYEFLIKYKALLVALFLLFLTVVVLQVNYNKNHMHDYTVDEYFTITSIHPSVTPDKTLHRALNGPRIFTYLFYPGALVGMINHMGGNIYEEGWNYPGHNYFVKNYALAGANLGNNMKDPNFRYFHYYLKLQAIIFMFFSLVPLIFLLWRQKQYVAMFMVSTLVGINFLALEERSLFYIEPLLLGMLNILTWLFFYLANKKHLNWFWILFSSFLFALTISLKFSSLFVIALIAVLLVSKFKTLEKRLTSSILLVLSSCLFFCLINWNIFYNKEVFNVVIHDYFSNFWQYATGNKRQVVENFKLYNLKRMIDEVYYSLGGLIYLMPLLLFFGFKWMPKKDVLKYMGFSFVILFSISLIVKQRVYIDRNILPFLTSLILISGIMLDSIINHIKKSELHKGKIKSIHLYSLLFLLIFLPIWGHAKNYFKTLIPSSKNNIEETIEKINNKGNRRLVTIDYNWPKENEDFLEIQEFNSAIPTFKDNFKTFIKNNINSFQEEDIVVISEIKNNKQLTTYLLPSIFNTNLQYGNHFIFYNTPKKHKKYQNLKAEFDGVETKKVLEDSLAIREDLVLREVRIAKTKNKYIVYFKLDFLAVNNKDWIGCRFSFHAKPNESDINLLPEERIELGYEGWDFTVTKNNMVRYGSSMYVFHEFEPSFKRYEEFSFGIFRGCTKSKNFKVSNINLIE